MGVWLEQLPGCGDAVERPWTTIDITSVVLKRIDAQLACAQDKLQLPCAGRKTNSGVCCTTLLEYDWIR